MKTANERATYFNSKFNVCLCRAEADVTELSSTIEQNKTKFNVNMECPSCHKKNNVDFLVDLDG